MDKYYLYWETEYLMTYGQFFTIGTQTEVREREASFSWKDSYLFLRSLLTPEESLFSLEWVREASTNLEAEELSVPLSQLTQGTSIVMNWVHWFFQYKID